MVEFNKKELMVYINKEDDKIKVFKATKEEIQKEIMCIEVEVFRQLNHAFTLTRNECKTDSFLVECGGLKYSTHVVMHPSTKLIDVVLDHSFRNIPTPVNE
jgi:hypothetical protein